ncbi:MAG TPA: hypothetical protein VHV78_12315 [Gemmatimonadaceae bacterium]|nr:hypothetical protein [Gemmatimonadaceae bacterium]
MQKDDYDLELRHTSEEDEVRDAAREVTARLASLRVWLSGEESDEALVQMDEAIDRFEEAVRAKGGDLMVDEPARGAIQPDRADFVLPARCADERVADYLVRLAGATDVVWQRPPIDR